MSRLVQRKLNVDQVRAVAAITLRCQQPARVHRPRLDARTDVEIISGQEEHFWFLGVKE